jgi:hypothetical protein
MVVVPYRPAAIHGGGIDVRARICKRLWSPGIDCASLSSLAGQYDKWGFVPARQAENRYMFSLKDLQIRPLGSLQVLVPSQSINASSDIRPI